MSVKREEKFKKLRESMTDDAQISIKLLFICGFSSTDVTRLKKEGILKSVSRGVYKLIDKSVLQDETEVNKYTSSKESNMPQVKVVSIKTVNKENPVRKIFTSLQEGNLEASIEVVRNYLTSISKREYEFFVVELIKAAIKEGDVLFRDAMSVIENMGRDNYTFDVQPCVTGFYRAVKARKFEAAKAYRDLLLKSRNFTKVYVDVIARAFSEYLEYHMDNDRQVRNTESTELLLTDATLREIKEKGMVVFHPTTEEEITKLEEYAAQNNEVGFFLLTKNEIILKINNSAWVDHAATAKAGKDAYKNGNYNECIAEYMKILQCPKINHRQFLYIGLAYYKLGNLPLALDYLIVAKELHIREMGKTNLGKIIREIKQKLATPNEVEVQDTTNILTIKDYGLAHMKEILELLNNGVDVEEIAIRFELVGNGVARLYLVAAEHSYQFEQYEAGDSYIEAIVSTPNMDETTLDAAYKIIMNRKLYHHIPSGDNGEQTLIRLNKNINEE